MMAWFYGARLVKTLSLESKKQTNTLKLAFLHQHISSETKTFAPRVWFRKKIIRGAMLVWGWFIMFHHFLSVTAWGQLQIAVPQAQRLNPRGDLERFHDWLTAAKCPKFVLNQNASKYRICPRFHKTQDHRFRHHLFLVSSRKKKVESFPIFPQLFMILVRMTSKHANSFPLQISGTLWPFT